MLDDDEIETVFLGFQTLISGLQVSNKSHKTKYHVKKFLLSSQVKWIPKVKAIQEAKELNNLVLKK